MDNKNNDSSRASKPTLIVHGGFDSTLEELYTTAAAALEEGAEEHCQSGAPALSNQRIFDWLDETFQKEVL